MMDVEQQTTCLDAASVVTVLLEEVNAITGYRTLRDTLPRRLARLLQCRCVLFYQRVGETLQLISGSFDDKPGWSSALLAIAHINPISLHDPMLEARAWHQRHPVSNAAPSKEPTQIAAPLLYRARGIGVLVVLRGDQPGDDTRHVPDTDALLPSVSATQHLPTCWQPEELQVIEAIAGVVAMLLENTRLLERDRERIQELSLLNSISRQFHASLRDTERVRNAIIQRSREISAADFCDCVLFPSSSGALPLPWITTGLQEELRQHLRSQPDADTAPLVIERPGDVTTGAYFSQLDPAIKTFFAIPLRAAHDALLGLVFGAYVRPWKLRREEIDMMTILANQASSVLENMALMAEVVEARNQARKLLRQVLDEQRLQALILESIPSGLLTVDLHGSITTCNRAAAALLGYTSLEIIGQPFQKMLSLRSLQNVIDTETPQSESVTIAFSPTLEKVVHVELLPFRNDRGKLIGTLATLVDMTMMHRLEEEKRRLDRLASLGQMSANVAHEVRNPLASIKTSMQMLLDDLENGTSDSRDGLPAPDAPEESMQESITVVLKEVERLDAIVRDLLQFSRPRQLHRVPCSLPELSERILRLIEQQCEQSGVLIHRVYREVPSVAVDIPQIEQVLLNLLLNALQAMPEGGILTITQQVVQQSVQVLEIKLDDMYGAGMGWLEVSISDTGTGIAADQLERVFQPFFTTRAHGIGLGLPISRRLIEDHGGQLFVESQLGFGATFTLRLPLETQGASGRSIDESVEFEEEDS